MRILMLGNSLTTANDLPTLLADRLDAEVVVHARGGARLAEHLNPKTRNGARTLEALHTQPWDFVVLQEMSHQPATKPATYLASVTALAELIHQADAKAVIYGTWAYAPSCPHLERIGLIYDEMVTKMHEAFLEARDAGNALLAEVGKAFHNYPNDEHALAELYASDGVHPSEAGTHLAAHVLAETMRAARY